VRAFLARYWIGLPLRSFFPGISFNSEAHCENYGLYYDSVVSSCRANGNQILTKFTVETTFREIYNFLPEGKAQKSRVALKNKSVDYVDLWKRFCATSSSPEAKETWFKIIHDILPVKERLSRFHITPDPMCAVCTEGKTESIGHLLLECTFSRKARVLCYQLIGEDAQRRCNVMDINFFTKEFFNSNEKAIIFSEYIYAVWIARKEVVFDKVNTDNDRPLHLFGYRLKMRIRADYHRMKASEFSLVWGKSKKLYYIDSREIKFNW
jgi:hypothetical protein